MYELAERSLAGLPGVRGATLVNPTPFRFALSLSVALTIGMAGAAHAQDDGATHRLEWRID